MTQTARRVLEDCRAALGELTQKVEGEFIHGDMWRRRWITVVVLLRMVWHVLESVDVKLSPAYSTAIKQASDRLKESKPEPDIYWSFIVDVRNKIVKDYELCAGQNVTLYMRGSGPPIPTLYEGVVNSGPFQGRL